MRPREERGTQARYGGKGVFPCTTVEETHPLGRKVGRIEDPAWKHVITRLREWSVSYVHPPRYYPYHEA